MFKGSIIHFQFCIVCCQASPLFIHKLGMLRLELAIDDFVSRALADDEVRKAMESATADGYTGPALQAVLLLTKKRGFETNKATFF